MREGSRVRLRETAWTRGSAVIYGDVDLVDGATAIVCWDSVDLRGNAHPLGGKRRAYWVADLEDVTRPLEAYSAEGLDLLAVGDA